MFMFLLVFGLGVLMSPNLTGSQAHRFTHSIDKYRESIFMLKQKLWLWTFIPWAHSKRESLHPWTRGADLGTLRTVKGKTLCQIFDSGLSTSLTHPASYQDNYEDKKHSSYLHQGNKLQLISCTAELWSQGHRPFNHCTMLPLSLINNNILFQLSLLHNWDTGRTIKFKKAFFIHKVSK